VIAARAFLIGLLLGAIDSVVNHVPWWLGEIGLARADRGGWSQAAEFASLILDAGWAWAAAAVLAGWLAGDRVSRGAAAGVVALAAATIAYYGSDAVIDGDGVWQMATRYWLTFSVVAGPLLGAAGALVRRPGWAGTIAGLVVPVGAATQMVVLPPAADSAMALPVRFTVWIGAALAAVLVARRHASSG